MYRDLYSAGRRGYVPPYPAAAITSTDTRSAVGDPKNLFNFPTFSLQAPDLSLVSS
jgi:hypothetical protein